MSNLVQSTKATKTVDGVATPTSAGTALKLFLDDKGQEAFLRLSKSLPAYTVAISSLARDLVVVPALKSASPVSLDRLAVDLAVVHGQIKDEPTRKRINKVLEPFLAVPHNKADLLTGDLAQGGLLAPAQVAPLKTPGEQEADRRRQALLTDALQKGIRILKVEAKADAPKEERTVLGVVLEPEEVDSQNDIYSESEIRKTAFRFMERYQQFGLMHKDIVPSVLPLESYLAPVDFTINGQKVKKGTWLVRVRVLDDGIWKDVRSGKLSGFSIGGSAIRTPDKVPAATAA